MVQLGVSTRSRELREGEKEKILINSIVNFNCKSHLNSPQKRLRGRYAARRGETAACKPRTHHQRSTLEHLYIFIGIERGKFTIHHKIKC